MNKKMDANGFSLVELIIIMGIMGVMVGASMNVLSYLKLGNVKKAANTVNTYIGETRSDDMTQTQDKAPTMILYQCSKGIYVVKTAVSTVNAVSATVTKTDGTNMVFDGTEGEKVANAGLTITCYKEGAASPTTLSDGDFIAIKFRKSTGAFSNDLDFYNKIAFANTTRTYEINMIKETGRYYIEG